MAANGPELLAPFGPDEDADWFRKAYKWNKNEILSWMDKVTKGQAGGPQKDAATVVVLKKIYNRITQLLHPNGSMYNNNTALPQSHIARKYNIKWGEGNDLTISKFILLPWLCAQDIPQTAPSPTPGSPKVPGWWSPYDLLGLFLSLLGPAPETANKNNYFLPLTAVYARWCTRIAGRCPGRWGWKPESSGAGHWPYMFQCTWQQLKVGDEGMNRPHLFFLGASTGGDEFAEKLVGTWRAEVQRGRFNMLFDCQRMAMVGQNDFVIKAANPLRKAPVPYGNCAETYPFVARVSATEDLNQSLKGLALRRDFTSAEKEPDYNGSSTGEIWANLVGPCGKCTNLIEKAGASISNFHKDSEIVTPGGSSRSNIPHDGNGVLVTGHGLDVADYPSTKEEQ